MRNRDVHIQKLSDEFGFYQLSIRCRPCGHTTVASPHTLARRFGWQCSLLTLQKHLVCAQCGQRAAEITAIPETPSRRR